MAERKNNNHTKPGGQAPSPSLSSSFCCSSSHHVLFPPKMFLSDSGKSWSCVKLMHLSVCFSCATLRRLQFAGATVKTQIWKWPAPSHFTVLFNISHWYFKTLICWRYALGVMAISMSFFLKCLLSSYDSSSISFPLFTLPSHILHALKHLLFFSVYEVVAVVNHAQTQKKTHMTTLSYPLLCTDGVSIPVVCVK